MGLYAHFSTTTRTWHLVREACEKGVRAVSRLIAARGSEYVREKGGTHAVALEAVWADLPDVQVMNLTIPPPVRTDVCVCLEKFSSACDRLSNYAMFHSVTLNDWDDMLGCVDIIYRVIRTLVSSCSATRRAQLMDLSEQFAVAIVSARLDWDSSGYNHRPGGDLICKKCFRDWKESTDY